MKLKFTDLKIRKDLCLPKDWVHWGSKKKIKSQIGNLEFSFFSYNNTNDIPPDESMMMLANDMLNQIRTIKKICVKHLWEELLKKIQELIKIYDKYNIQKNGFSLVKFLEKAFVEDFTKHLKKLKDLYNINLKIETLPIKNTLEEILESKTYIAKDWLFDLIHIGSFSVYKNNSTPTKFKKRPYHGVFSFELPWVEENGDHLYSVFDYVDGQLKLRNKNESGQNPQEIIDTTLEELGLSSEKELLKPYIKPSINIEFSDKSSIKSHFGGNPRLITGTPWPEHEFGPYRFLAYIDFAEVKDENSLLPMDGILNLFVADDSEGRTFWGDEGYIKGIYYKKGEKLRINKSPKSVANPEKYLIEFKKSLDLPPSKIHEFDFGEEYEDTYFIHEMRNDLNESGHHLLGYPGYCTLAYDPTPSPEYISLLTLSSDNDLEWCWHDGDKLMIFIEKEKLLKRDFSNLKSDAG